MKRSRTERKISRTGDIRKDLSDAQLAGIGMVALAYNEAELLIDLALSLGAKIEWDMFKAITSRINGVDGKIEIAKLGFKLAGGSDEAQVLLANTLGNDGFALLKQYRDAIIHARVLDAPAGIALSPARRGKENEVLLTTDALNGVYERLALVRKELIEACRIMIKLPRDLPPVSTGLKQPRASVLMRLQNEPTIRDAIARYREHQSHRLSLPPLPEFPEEPPIPQETEDAPARSEDRG